VNEKRPSGPSRFQANFFLSSIENDSPEQGFAGARNPNSDRPTVPAGNTTIISVLSGLGL